MTDQVLWSNISFCDGAVKTNQCDRGSNLSWARWLLLVLGEGFLNIYKPIIWLTEKGSPLGPLSVGGGIRNLKG